MKAWKDRTLSECGRALLLNTFALSKTWFACHLFSLSKSTISSINSICRLVIWRGKRPKIDLSKVCRSKREGGLGLIPIEIQSHCIRAKWFARVFSQDAPAWCSVARQLLGSHLAKTKLPPHALLTNKFTRRNCHRIPEQWIGRLISWSAVGGGLADIDRLPLETIMSLPAEATIKTKSGKPYVPRRPVYIKDILVWLPDLKRFGRNRERSL